jgi:large subunit ribosomal protein L21
LSGLLKEAAAVYAIVRSGGKQYRVAEGDTVYVERLSAPAGESVTLDEVLLVGGDGAVRVGTPRVTGASVQGTVLAQVRDSKVRVFKYKKRKHYRRTRGHRQSLTAVRIDKVQA